jgi:hypothetical protein
VAILASRSEANAERFLSCQTKLPPMKRILLSFSIIGLFILFTGIPATAQWQKNYQYLPACFNAKGIDTAQIEIDGIGEVEVMDYSSDSLEETGLMIYRVPEKKRDKSLAKLAMTATQFHVKLWKNNSKVLVKNEMQLDGAAMVDLRLHMLIENIYLQIVTICEGDTIYQLSIFRDTNDTAYFDKVVATLKEKKCL